MPTGTAAFRMPTFPQIPTVLPEVPAPAPATSLPKRFADLPLETQTALTDLFTNLKDLDSAVSYEDMQIALIGHPSAQTILGLISNLPASADDVFYRIPLELLDPETLNKINDSLKDMRDGVLERVVEVGSVAVGIASRYAVDKTGLDLFDTKVKAKNQATGLEASGSLDTAHITQTDSDFTSYGHNLTFNGTVGSTSFQGIANEGTIQTSDEAVQWDMQGVTIDGANPDLSWHFQTQGAVGHSLGEEQEALAHNFDFELAYGDTTITVNGKEGHYTQTDKDTTLEGSGLSGTVLNQKNKIAADFSAQTIAASQSGAQQQLSATGINAAGTVQDYQFTGSADAVNYAKNIDTEQISAANLAATVVNPDQGIAATASAQTIAASQSGAQQQLSATGINAAGTVQDYQFTGSADAVNYA
ncbi:hypothetical protein RDn1_159, partial [Candidatus Termititenax dinenymphae]